MSAIWLLVLATGVTPFQPGDLSTAQPATAVAATQPAAMALSPAAAVVDPAARSPQQLRDAVTAALKRINGAKGADRAAAITTMTDLYSEISRDRQLTQPERQRLAAQLRTRLQRCAAQLRYELAHAGAVARSNSAISGSASSQASLPTAAQTGAAQTGAAGGPAAEGLDQLVDLIQMTLGGPDNWLPAQRAVNAPAGQGGAGFGVGMGGGGQNGNQGAGGGAGGFQQQAQANGEALVDLIEKTIAPESWDINGGPGSIVYYGNFHALVVRQSEEGQSDVGNLLKALGR